MKGLKLFGKVCITVLLCLAVLLSVGLVVPLAMGWTPYVVLSGSMEPVYPVGSLLYVRPVTAETIEQGDVITYRLQGGDTVVTHRVVEINAEEGTFITKGDANDTEDMVPVASSALAGEPVFHLPYVGYAAAQFATARGRIIACIIAVTLILLVALSEIAKRCLTGNSGEKEEGCAEDKR